MFLVWMVVCECGELIDLMLMKGASPRRCMVQYAILALSLIIKNTSAV